MSKTALIFGANGQDGSYLAELLLEKGYKVHGVVRPASTNNRERIDHIFPEGKREKFLHYGDISDPWSVAQIIKKVKPDEIYNLAAMSHVGVSWQMPYYSAQVDGLGILNILEAVRLLDLKCKIYQASTSELFAGREWEAPYDEKSSKDPVSPYGTAKLYAFQICKNYREAYGMFVVNGILFNHESPRRGENFVTQKIVKAVRKGEVVLGNMLASRDWGYAPEYVEAMWAMMQAKKPDDYVIATGESYSIREFVEFVEKASGTKINVIKDKYYERPHDVNYLKGNPRKALEELGWTAKTKGEDLAKEMLGDTFFICRCPKGKKSGENGLVHRVPIDCQE